MSTTSPNMNLVIPTIAVDSGLVWEQSINADLLILDQHNHSPGSGQPITPAGLNISSDLSINNNNLTVARSLRLNPQTSPLALTADLGCLYESGVDLYYNDGSGNQIRITQSGSVSGSAGTITGLPSGTASASFGAGIFVFQAATNTAANLDVGSVLLRNNVASSKALTLAPPNAMGANYNLVLPSLPGAQQIMTLDSSGVMAAPYTVDNSTLTISSNVIEVAPLGITAAQMANGTITTAQISASAAITGTQLASDTIDVSNMLTTSVATSGTSSTYSNATSSFSTIVSQAITLEKSDRPLMVQFTGPAIRSTDIEANSIEIRIQNTTDGTTLALWSVLSDNVGGDFFEYPINSFSFIGTPGATGSKTYALQARVSSSSTCTVSAIAGITMTMFQV